MVLIAVMLMLYVPTLMGALLVLVGLVMLRTEKLVLVTLMYKSLECL